MSIQMSASPNNVSDGPTRKVALDGRGVLGVKGAELRPGVPGDSGLTNGISSRGTGYQLGARLDDGEVYEASHPLFSCHLVLKLFPREKDNAAAVKAFFKEAGRVSLLRHPAIVQVLDLGLMKDRTPFVSMEWLSGTTLDRRLTDGQPLLMSELTPLLQGIASALSVAHAAGVVHREIRPDNIFVVDRPDRPDGLVKVLDFGVSRLTRSGQARGDRLKYLAPEQLEGDPSRIDARADQFALAALTYRMLTGADPFPPLTNTPIDTTLSGIGTGSRSTPRPITPSIRGTSPLDAVLARALSSNPADRYPSVPAFFRAFEEAVVSCEPDTGPADLGRFSDDATSEGAAISDAAITKEMELPETPPPPPQARPVTARLPAERSRRDSRGWQGAVTKQFFEDGELQEAKQWKGSPLAREVALPDPEAEFDSFDTIPRRRAPRIAIAMLVVGACAGGWALTHDYRPRWLNLPQLRSIASILSPRTPAATAPTPAPIPTAPAAVAPEVIGANAAPVTAAEAAPAAPAPVAVPPPSAPIAANTASKSVAPDTRPVAARPAAAVPPVAAAVPSSAADEPGAQGESTPTPPKRGGVLRGYVWSPREQRLIPSRQASRPPEPTQDSSAGVDRPTLTTPPLSSTLSPTPSTSPSTSPPPAPATTVEPEIGPDETLPPRP